MFWRRKEVSGAAAMDDPEVAAVLEEITNRLNATSTRLKNFSTDLQANINTLKRHAAIAEKRVQENK